jgi:hypothetical protein
MVSIFDRRSRRLPLRKLAEREGVRRPYEILTSMDADSRARIAAHLGVSIDHLGGDAAREAWAILHRDLRGMQARGHLGFERLLPVRNITWAEMLRRTARYFHLPTGGSVNDLERRIYESFADRIVSTWNPDEVSLCDAMASVQPWVLRLRERLTLSRNGVRLAVRTLPTRSWIEILGVATAIAPSRRLGSLTARLWARAAPAVDGVARRVPPLRVPLWLGAQAASFMALVLVPHHARNAPVVVTLVLQSLHRTAADPTAAFWHSI